MGDVKDWYGDIKKDELYDQMFPGQAGDFLFPKESNDDNVSPEDWEELMNEKITNKKEKEAFEIHLSILRNKGFRWLDPKSEKKTRTGPHDAIGYGLEPNSKSTTTTTTTTTTSTDTTTKQPEEIKDS